MGGSGGLTAKFSIVYPLALKPLVSSCSESDALFVRVRVEFRSSIYPIIPESQKRSGRDLPPYPLKVNEEFEFIWRETYNFRTALSSFVTNAILLHIYYMTHHSFHAKLVSGHI